MRADGEISKEEYRDKKQDCEKRISLIENDLAGHEKKRGLQKIQMIDFSSGIIDHDMLT